MKHHLAAAAALCAATGACSAEGMWTFDNPPLKAMQHDIGWAPTPAWLGAKSQRPVQIRLYKTTWNNPRAAVPVERIDFISVTTNAAPFLVAVTAEP